MGAFSNFMEEKIIDSFLRNSAYTPTNTHLALFESDPGETGGGTETNYTGYLRQQTAWTAYAAGQTMNVDLEQFPANGNASASVTITHIGVYDAATRGTGNLLMYAALTTPKTLAVGDVLAFAANACVFTLD